MDEMTNYTNMLRMNEKVCEEKRILAIDTIRRMVRDNEQITICELTKQTGLSRSFFYKNAVVNMELNTALKAQQGKILSSKRDKKLNEALKETVKLQKDEIENSAWRNQDLPLKLRDSKTNNKMT